MEGSSEFQDLLKQTSEKVLRALDASPDGPEGRSAWELKVELKVPNALLYLALGSLSRDGVIEIAPRELSYRIKRAHASKLVPGQPGLQ